MVNGVRDEKGVADDGKARRDDGCGGGSDSGGSRRFDYFRLDKYGAAFIACAVVAGVASPVIVLLTFSHHPEPLQTAAWAAAFIMSLSTVAMLGANVVWVMKRGESAEQRIMARFDELQKEKEETNRRLRILADKAGADLKSLEGGRADGGHPNG